MPRAPATFFILSRSQTTDSISRVRVCEHPHSSSEKQILQKINFGKKFFTKRRAFKFNRQRVKITTLLGSLKVKTFFYMLGNLL